jgi:ABC-2 type transport system permease protein
MTSLHSTPLYPTLYLAALWAEALKARRSLVPWLTALGFSLAPLAGGLFMFILQDPVRARTMGIISAKAQLTAGTADWPAMLGLLAQAAAGGGTMLFAIVTAWVFGREFSDHTAKELLALPTPRAAIVAGKFVVIVIWTAGLAALVFGLGLAVGAVVGLPGWSAALIQRSAVDVVIIWSLTLGLMPFVALLASAGRGYLPPIGWAIFTLALAQLAAATGWGDWFPWAVPVLFSTPGRSAQIGPHSYVVVVLAGVVGLVSVFRWWHSADQTR